MLGTGKCPSCGQVPFRINIQSVDMQTPDGTTYRGVSYVCPNAACQTILGASIDPVAIKSDILAKVQKLLGR